MIDCSVTTELYDRLQSQVHVWFCQPEAIKDKVKISEYESVLSEQEFAQYHRFNHEKDKHSYLVSHALLRYSLSQYADVRASQWRFSSNEHGKPELMSPPGIKGIRFNLTHTDGLSACVITLNRNCGIDAENINRKNKLKAVAQRMFAEEELALLDDKNLQQRFYYLWTLREAYVKALGTGLAGSSKEFYFDIDMSDRNVVVQHKDEQRSGDKSWYFALYEPTLEHVLALGFEPSDGAQIVVTELVP